MIVHHAHTTQGRSSGKIGVSLLFELTMNIQALFKVDIASSIAPSLLPSHPPLPKGNPGAGKSAIHMVMYDTTKEERILGLKKRTMDDVTRDSLVYFEKIANKSIMR
jgi:hypothetical protein